MRKIIPIILSLAIFGCGSNGNVGKSNDVKTYKSITYSELLDIAANSFIEEQEKYGGLNDKYTYRSIVSYSFPKFYNENSDDNFSIHGKLKESLNEIKYNASKVKSNDNLYSTYANMRVTDDYDYDTGRLDLTPIDNNSILLTKSNKKEVQEKLDSGMFGGSAFRIVNLKNYGIPIKMSKDEASDLYKNSASQNHIVCVKIFYDILNVQNTTINAQVDAIKLAVPSLCEYNT